MKVMTISFFEMQLTKRHKPWKCNKALKRSNAQLIAFKTLTTFQDLTIEHALLVQEFQV